MLMFPGRRYIFYSDIWDNEGLCYDISTVQFFCFFFILQIMISSSKFLFKSCMRSRCQDQKGGMTFSFLLPKFLIFQKHKACLIPAVEVELPGCSFNPPLEAHQKYFLEADDGNESEIEEETDNDTNELPGQRFAFSNPFFSS
ncbi:hypothetical protein B296_00015043 [Ensete ventricosum]|uniref:Uncharacterized protein n=1 Tax=Ensete ventricosum TaxID=4639 RepID=A0A427ATY7_ENSVE|nr:hypothetical protein B296_00015043 [Ensete ventricosum]